MAVIANMSVSTGGMLRLHKGIREIADFKAGDRIVVMADGDDNISIQLQRERRVYFRFHGKIERL